ncbi:MAG TPA: S9 family peptidase [Actinomycetes bacterium]|jgi:dipeptidyl aminopeptidase/acylaminoacyl peptidase|nr:S9 family peptidase [Actinomycetes bacterium]
MTTQLIPREVLFGNPEKASPAISPDGTRIAWLAPVDGVLNVWVGHVGADDAAPVTRDTDRGVRDYRWAHDDRHLLYVQDLGGDENWHLYAVDLDSGETRDLTPFDGVQAQLVATDKRFPDRVLVGLNRDNPELHDVYQADLASGRLDLVASNPGFVGWVADAELRVRCGVAATPDGGLAVMVRDDGEGEWRQALLVGQEDALGTSPVSFSRDGSSLLLISSEEANAARLVRLDLAGGDRKVLFEDPRYDVQNVVLHPDTREPELVSVLRDRAELEALDPALADELAAIRAVHPGDPAFLGRDHADRTWLLAFTADDGPVSYYAWDRAAREATFLFSHRPELERYQLAKMEPFTYTARDGLEVHGYLSFPPSAARSGLPTVLKVHGGPWWRDAWGLDPEAQWLANRGYLCVQVNFRGSTGYGKAFLNAGDREWGGAMHDDLVDAVRFVVGRGWADPARVAIYGGSYGGYAALVGATFTPDLFRCAVDIVGPSNLKTLIESVPPYWKPMVSLFHTRVGNPDTEAEFLWSRSPLSRVEQIRIPVLIVQGANDPRVKQAESEQIVAAMRDKGIAYEYLLFEDEGHGFAKPGNRLRFYAHAERFLAEHLGGRSQPDPGD